MSSPLASSQRLRCPAWSPPSPSTWHLPPAPPTPETAPSSSSSHMLPATTATTTSSLSAETAQFSPSSQDRYLPLQTFSSPSSTPLPAQSHALLEAKRQSLFAAGPSNRSGATTRPSPQHHSTLAHTPSRSRYAVADTGRLSGNRARPHHRSNDAAASSFSSPDRPLAGAAGAALDQDSPTRQVWRAKFRQRCQQQMARDRARTLGATRGASFLRFMGPDGDGDGDDDELLLTPGHAEPSGLRPKRSEMIGSDDLPSSSDTEAAEIDQDAPSGGGGGGGAGSKWWEEDEELIRRVMVAEYRRIKRAQEVSGEREVGWLDPDEVAYLEEETKREENEMRTASSYAGTQRRPPPADLTPTRNVGPAWAPGAGISFAAKTESRSNVGTADDTPRADAAELELELEPPEDLLDDDEALYNHYLEYQNQAISSVPGAVEDDNDEVMEKEEGGCGQGSMQQMSQSWEGDEDFEMALAAMPMPQD